MKVTIKSTGKQYNISQLYDFGHLTNMLLRWDYRIYDRISIFQASIETETGTQTIVGKAQRGELVGEFCDISTIRENKEEDIKAILSLRDSLFIEMTSESVYAPNNKTIIPMSFEEVIRYLVTMKYEKLNAKNINENTQETISKDTRYKDANKTDAQINTCDNVKQNKKPLYNLGDKFALIRMGRVLAPVEVVRRAIVKNYDNQQDADFCYDIQLKIEGSKPLVYKSINERELVDWGNDSRKMLMADKSYNECKKEIGNYTGLVNIEVEPDIINTIPDNQIIQTPKKPEEKWGCGIVVINDEGKALMGLRCKKNDLSQWCFIGGGIESGETPIEAATREMKEESNLWPLELEYLENYNMNGFKDFVFISRKFLGEPKPQEGELAELRWVSIEEAEKLPLFNYTIETMKRVKGYLK